MENEKEALIDWYKVEAVNLLVINIDDILMFMSIFVPAIFWHLDKIFNLVGMLMLFSLFNILYDNNVIYSLSCFVEWNVPVITLWDKIGNGYQYISNNENKNIYHIEINN